LIPKKKKKTIRFCLPTSENNNGTQFVHIGDTKRFSSFLFKNKYLKYKSSSFTVKGRLLVVVNISWDYNVMCTYLFIRTYFSGPSVLCPYTYARHIVWGLSLTELPLPWYCIDCIRHRVYKPQLCISQKFNSFTILKWNFSTCNYPRI